MEMVDSVAQGACNMSGVCNGCPDRKIITVGETYNCHDHCERYAEEVRAHRELVEKRLNGRILDKAYGDYVADKNYRLRTKYGKRR